MRRFRLVLAISGLAVLILFLVSIQVWKNFGPVQLATGVPSPLGTRTVALNNYNNWMAPMTFQPDYDAKVRMLASCDRVCMTEMYDISSQLNAAALKQMNPNLRVFRVYDLCVKNDWDADWADSSDQRHMQTPLSRVEIDANDWWLRDGNGNVVRENGDTIFLDVGKPGFKETYLSNMLERMSGEDFDGVLLDYWCWYTVGWVVIHRGFPPPPQYPNDDAWFTKAWQPFVSYVVAGLHQAGYTVIGNCAGGFTTTNTMELWQRSLIDGTVCEEGAVGFSTVAGDWLPGDVIEQRIYELARDPLEIWFGNEGLRPEITDLQRKVAVSLAMYYIGIPPSPDQRSYSYRYDSRVHWDPLWDFYIGTPYTAAVQPYRKDSPTSLTTRRYFWTRRYTQGLVILNYNNSPSGISYKLPGRFITPDGRYLTGRIIVQAHSALILRDATLVGTTFSLSEY